MFVRGLSVTPVHGCSWRSNSCLVCADRNREVAPQHLGLSEKLRRFMAAYPCKVLEIADRRATNRTWDRDGATQE